ncbi:hypothetical protein WA026_014745 [Henosepilachna vigintioctopunctata]|uniref:Uncharacterized protein n=1 Tax=Henosepilachna vigintioctopunctata TaxID=420089 RepID=A0AAW1VH02_9CUCU
MGFLVCTANGIGDVSLGENKVKFSDEKWTTKGARATQCVNHEVIAPPPATKTKVATKLNHHPDKGGECERDANAPIARTESHVTRFNHARALFEKLGEENSRNSRRDNHHNRVGVVTAQPLQTTKSASNVLDATTRSRSSSANSEPPAGQHDCRSFEFESASSRSPSPPVSTRRIEKINDEKTCHLLNDNNKSKSNGVPYVKSPTNRMSFEEQQQNNLIETNGNIVRPTDDRNSSKPALMKKPDRPDKPERKLNSKELIEKQRNWTSHFSKSRSNRYSSDPNRQTEVKLQASRSSMDNPDNRTVTSASVTSAAARSASFNNKVLRSPPTSPPPPPVRTEASRRVNVTRKERPASVIPTPYKSPIASPTKDVAVRSSESHNNVTSASKKGPLFKQEENGLASLNNDYIFKNNAYVESINNFCLHPPPSLVGGAVSKSPLSSSDDHDANRECLSGSLSSLSPPSSPSKLKSENEKQEQESNEKSLLNRGKSINSFYHNMNGSENINSVIAFRFFEYVLDGYPLVVWLYSESWYLPIKLLFPFLILVQPSDK